MEREGIDGWDDGERGKKSDSGDKNEGELGGRHRIVVYLMIELPWWATEARKASV